MLSASVQSRAGFAAIAPRLERAHRERLVEMDQERRERSVVLWVLQDVEALVAHRELQYQRACATQSAERQRRRYRKLQEAYDRLERIQQRARLLGVRVQRRAA